MPPSGVNVPLVEFSARQNAAAWLYVDVSVYFLGLGIQDPGWNVFPVLEGSSLISCLPKLVEAAWPVARVFAGVATRPSAYSLACRARSLSSASLAFTLICCL